MAKRIADALVARGLLDRVRADAALRDQSRTGLGFGQLVVERKWVPDDVYADVVAMAYGIERLRLERVAPDPAVIADITESWVREHELIPLHAVLERREVLVAATDPENYKGTDALAFRLGRRLRLAAASRSEMERLIRHLFHREPLGGEPGSDGPRDLLARAVGENRQAAHALRAIFDLCVERGLLTREDLQRRMRES